MNARITLLLAVLLSVVIMSVAFSYPSLMGPTGLSTFPTADVPQKGAVDLAVDFQNTDDFFGDIWLTRAAVGVDKNLEVSLMYTAVGGETRFDSGRLWDIGVKYVLLDRPEEGLKVAVGTAYGDFQNSWELKGFGGYVMASKNFFPAAQPADKVRVRGHLGAVYGRIKEREPGFGFDTNLFEPLIGLEVLFPAGTVLAVDYRPAKKSIEENDVYGVVVRHSFTENLSAEIGTANEFSDPHKQRIFYGLSYHWMSEKGK